MAEQIPSQLNFEGNRRTQLVCSRECDDSRQRSCAVSSHDDQGVEDRSPRNLGRVKRKLFWVENPVNGIVRRQRPSREPQSEFPIRRARTLQRPGLSVRGPLFRRDPACRAGSHRSTRFQQIKCSSTTPHHRWSAHAVRQPVRKRRS